MFKVAEHNSICKFCDSFILKGEEYSDELGCNHCSYIVKNMIEDGGSDFKDYIHEQNIPFKERVINEGDLK